LPKIKRFDLITMKEIIKMKAFKLSLFFSIVLLSLIFSIKKNGVIQEKEPNIVSEEHAMTDKKTGRRRKVTPTKKAESHKDKFVNKLLSYGFKNFILTGENNRYVLNSNAVKKYTVEDMIKLLDVDKVDFVHVNIPRLDHSELAMMVKKGIYQCSLIFYYDPSINNNDKFFTEAIEYGATWKEIEQKRVKGIPDAFLNNKVYSSSVWVYNDKEAPLKYPVSPGPPYIFTQPRVDSKKD